MTVPLLLPVSNAPEGSPEWWRDRLRAKLAHRRKDDSTAHPIGGTAITRYGVDTLQAYYECRPAYPWVSPDSIDEFAGLMDLTRSSYMGLVSDTQVERCQVQGLRFGSDDAESGADSLDSLDVGDGEAWSIWQFNGLDSAFNQGLLAATVCGSAYLMVAPNLADPGMPLITVEHPSQMIVEYDAGTRRSRRASLKEWRDDWTGQTFVTMQLRDDVTGAVWIYKWRTLAVGGLDLPGRYAGGFVERRVQGEDWPARSPLPVVSVVEIPNRPDLLRGGVSEFADVIAAQNRIAKTIWDRMLTQDVGAFPQKYALGFPLYNEKGERVRLDSGRTRLLATEVSKNDAAFGQFEAAMLAPYIEAKRSDIEEIASRTRTPAQYLLGQMVNVSGDALTAAESGLVAKVWERQVPYGEAVEEAMRLAFALRGDAERAQDYGAEVIWRNPQFRTEGELVDALVKLRQVGLGPRRQILLRYGLSPKEVQRWIAELDAEQSAGDQAVNNLTASLAGDGSAGDG